MELGRCHVVGVVADCLVADAKVWRWGSVIGSFAIAAQSFEPVVPQVVQDADRLDAIGIARAFAYGGAKGRLIHDPEAKPEEHETAEAYITSTGTTVNHFYEKLLLLKDRMNTATGRAMAHKRHQFLEGFLRRFYEEWEGE